MSAGHYNRKSSYTALSSPGEAEVTVIGIMSTNIVAARYKVGN